MTAFATFVTGRYTRWFVISVWVIVAAMAGSLQPKLQEETSNETITYLPGESDAATVAKLQKSAFESGAETPAVIVFTARDGGSVAEHQANIRKVLDALGGGSINKTGDPVSPYSPQGQQMGMREEVKVVSEPQPGTDGDSRSRPTRFRRRQSASCRSCERSREKRPVMPMARR